MVLIVIKVLLMTLAYLQSMTFRIVNTLTSDPDKYPIHGSSCDSPSTQINCRLVDHLYLLWALGDIEPRNRLQLIQCAPCVSQTTSTDHWHLGDRHTECAPHPPHCSPCPHFLSPLVRTPAEVTFFQAVVIFSNILNSSCGCPIAGKKNKLYLVGSNLSVGQELALIILVLSKGQEEKDPALPLRVL